MKLRFYRFSTILCSCLCIAVCFFAYFSSTDQEPFTTTLPDQSTLAPIAIALPPAYAAWVSPKGQIFLSDLFSAPKFDKEDTSAALIVRSNDFCDCFTINQVLQSPHSLTYQANLNTPNGTLVFLSYDNSLPPASLKENQFNSNLNVTLTRINPPPSNSHIVSSTITLYSHCLDQEFTLNLGDSLELKWIVDITLNNAPFRLTPENASIFSENISHQVSHIDFNKKTLTIDSFIHPHITARKTFTFN